MTLRLRHFVDVNNNGHMLLATSFFSFAVGLAKAFVVPAFYSEYLESFLVFCTLESSKYFGDAALCCLKLVGYRDPVVIVPNGGEHGHLQYAGSINGFEEHSF